MRGLPQGNISEETDLGVTVTEFLKPSKQGNIAASEANRILGMIKKIFSWMDGVVLTKLYKTLVKLRLKYCIQAWNPYHQRNTDTLDKVQKWPTKMVSG